MMYDRTVDIRIDVVRDLMERMLAAVGVDTETAKTLADLHLECDLRGVGVQGLNHLINSHLQDYQSGRADPKAKPRVVEEGDAYALIDGQSGPGQLAALLAAETAAKKARAAGCSVVGVRNSHDLFMAGYYAEQMAREGVVGFVLSDDVVPVVHPLGGVEPVIGSNPMAIGVPTETEPYIIDFAPCATLPTHVRYAKRYGKTLPEGVVADAQGGRTTDPREVCDGDGFQPHTGAINPLGNKGYGLLLVIDFLAGAFVGCAMGTDHALKPGAMKGHFFMAADPAKFGGLTAFKRAVSGRIKQVKESTKAPGVGEIRVPGERSFASRGRALRDGKVTIDEICWEDALKLAAELEIDVPAR